MRGIALTPLQTQTFSETSDQYKHNGCAIQVNLPQSSFVAEWDEHRRSYGRDRNSPDNVVDFSELPKTCDSVVVCHVNCEDAMDRLQEPRQGQVEAIMNEV